jgi:hypothetical protein
MCFINVQKEGESDFENFSTRITGFGVVVEKIWSFEVSGAILSFFLRLRTPLDLFSKF